MAPPSADLQEEEGVGANGATNGGYLHLSDNLTSSEDESLGYNPLSNGVANGQVEETEQNNEYLQVERPRSQGTVVNVNGVDITVYGNIQGLEFLNLGNAGGPVIDVDVVDSEEEEEELRQRIAAERAIREADEADLARRAAPLPPEQCQTIRNAMRGITLAFQPDWAGSVPEQEWISRLQSGGCAYETSPGGNWDP